MAVEVATVGASPPAPSPVVPSGLPTGQIIPPLDVSGLLVSRSALVAALRLWLPQVADVEPLGGAFLLRLAGDAPGAEAISETGRRAP